MVTKVRERQGGGKHPRKLRGLAFLLSVLIFLSSSFPFTAFAYGVVNGQGTLTVTATTSSSAIYQTTEAYGEGVQVRYSNAKLMQTDLDTITILANFNASVSKGDLLEFDFVLPLGRYQGFDFSVDCYTLTSAGARSKTIFKNSGSVYNDTNYSFGDLSYYYSYSMAAGSSNTFHFENSINYSYNGSIYYSIVLSNFKYSTLTETLKVYLNDFTISVEKPDTNNTNKLLDFIRNIFEGIQNIFVAIGNLPSLIGSFIISLGENIGNFFSNLVNNLGSWFSSVGDWFSQLGENIKAWFNSLGDRIGGFFTQIYIDITEFLKSLFMPSEDYFENLQKDLDQHMSDHLGAVYNVPKKLLEHLKEIITGLEAADGSHLIIHFPEIAFKLNGKRYSIFGGIDYDLLEPINSLDDPTTKSMVNVALILMHGFIDLGMAVAAFKMIYKQIINKVGIEGGNDL